MTAFLVNQLKEKWWGLAQAIVVAALTGLITIYGTTAKLQAGFEGLCVRMDRVEKQMDKTIELFVQHMIAGKGGK